MWMFWSALAACGALTVLMCLSEWMSARRRRFVDEGYRASALRHYRTYHLCDRVLDLDDETRRRVQATERGMVA